MSDNALFAFAAVLFFLSLVLFSGSPDLHSAFVSYLMNRCTP